MSEDRRELIHEIFRMISSGDLTRLGELVDPEYEEHGPFPTAPGIEGFRELVDMFRAAFPDMEVHAVDPIVEGDRAAWRVEGTGTHLGEFNGIPPTGKRVTFTGVDMGEIRNGKAYRHWSSPDVLGLLQQLGAIPQMDALIARR